MAPGRHYTPDLALLSSEQTPTPSRPNSLLAAISRVWHRHGEPGKSTIQPRQPVTMCPGKASRVQLQPLRPVSQRQHSRLMTASLSSGSPTLRHAAPRASGVEAAGGRDRRGERGAQAARSGGNVPPTAVWPRVAEQGDGTGRAPCQLLTRRTEQLAGSLAGLTPRPRGTIGH